MHFRLAIGDLRVIPTGHDDHDVGLGGLDLCPGALLGGLAGEPEHVITARIVDQLGRPVPGRKRWIKPLECHYANTPSTANRQPYAIDPCGRLAHQLDGRVLAIRGLGEGAGVAEHLAHGVRVK